MKVQQNFITTLRLERWTIVLKAPLWPFLDLFVHLSILMSSSSHIRDVSNLEIVVELYLLFFFSITVLVEYHSKNELLAFLGMD